VFGKIGILMKVNEITPNVTLEQDAYFVRVPQRGGVSSASRGPSFTTTLRAFKSL
jgi:hypothetical protein